jgi:hypothetical protein
MPELELHPRDLLTDAAGRNGDGTPVTPLLTQACGDRAAAALAGRPDELPRPCWH